MPARVLAVLLICVSSASAAEPKFEAVVIDENCANVAVYAVTTADVDGDKKDDVVAVTENRVLWYRNPDWKRHVIIEDQTERDNVCIAAHDVDGDGKLDFALGAGWLNGKNLGTIQWLSRGKSLEERWTVHPIGAISWTHRMRFGDVLGLGRPQLTVSPLNATNGAGVELSAYEIPADPRKDMWKRTVVDHSLNRMHNHWHLKVQQGHDGFFTASQEGVHLLAKAGNDWQRIQIGRGAEGSKPEEQGAGEVKLGTLKDRRKFLATVEPMHGHMAVVYLLAAGQETEPSRKRIVLDDTLKQGHAVGCADFDGDQDDDVAVGFREPGTGDVKGPGVFVFENVDGNGETWKKHVIDNGGMATEDLVVADLNADGRPDIVAGGRATKNVKLYVNRKVE
jgi:hypothetical protein